MIDKHNNHEVWVACKICGFEFDLRMGGCPECKVAKSRNNKRIGGIYCLRNVETNDVYIGLTKYFGSRKALHFSTLKRQIHRSALMQKIYNEKGCSIFSFEIVEVVEDSQLLSEREKYYIELLKPKYNAMYADNELNRAWRKGVSERMIGNTNGFNAWGHPKSERTRRLCYENSTNKKLTEDQVREIRALYQQHIMSNRKMAKLFNVSRAAIDGVINNIYHKFVA